MRKRNYDLFGWNLRADPRMNEWKIKKQFEAASMNLMSSEDER